MRFPMTSPLRLGVCIVLLLTAFLTGCARTMQYTPHPSGESYQLPGLPLSIVEVRVNDLRPDKSNSESLCDVLRKEVIASLSEKSVQQTLIRYILTIDIIEHRSVFKPGTWTGSTRFRIRLADSNGNQIGQWEAGENVSLPNFLGYAQAEMASQAAYGHKRNRENAITEWNEQRP
jgi:hypothetical protein